MKGHHLLEGRGVGKAIKRTANLRVSLGPHHCGLVPNQATLWLGLRWNDDAELP